jgi:hypothetical protein
MTVQTAQEPAKGLEGRDAVATVGRLSVPVLPAAWIATPVEAGEDFDFGRVNAIDQPIGKMPEASAANGIVNRLKLPGIVAHLLNQGLVLVKEPDGQAGLNVRVPFQRSGKFGMRWRC